ncbi:MAG: ATP-binding protein [Planctomycetota bacterium]
MRAIVMGQVGIDKKRYLESVAKLAASRGEVLHVYHVGDRMYAEAPDVHAGRILDLPLSRLHSLRRSVFKDIISESSDQANVIVNTHATFRWRHGLFRAFDFDQIEKFNPDMFVCLVDNVEAIHHRLRSEHTLDATLKDLMVWREEEILATELLALGIGSRKPCFVLPRGRINSTAQTCFRLVCRPRMRKVYLSFPMSHVVDMPDVLAEIDAFRAALAGKFVAFDPGDVDEKMLLESAIKAAKSGQDFIEGHVAALDGSMVTVKVSVKQVLETASDIDGQIYARDFQLIDQADMIISLIPELANGVPGLSSGVERELHHAYEHSKEVYVIWRPRRNPSPFITETATRVFHSTEEAVAYFESAGMFVETGLFGN